MTHKQFFDTTGNAKGSQLIRQGCKLFTVLMQALEAKQARGNNQYDNDSQISDQE